LGAKSIDEPPHQEGVLPPLDQLHLSEALVWVYVHWLALLSKGPKWPKNDRTQAIDRVLHLRHWVSEQLPQIHAQLAKSVVDIWSSRQRVRFRHLFPQELIPVQLAEEAGFTPQEFYTSGQWPTAVLRLAMLEAAVRNSNLAQRIRTRTLSPNRRTRNERTLTQEGQR